LFNHFEIQSTFKNLIMKKQFILIGAALLFSLLFYRQEIGLNFVLFTLLNCLVTYSTTGKTWNRQTWIAASLYVLSALPVLFYANKIVILSNVSCLFYFLGKINEAKASLFVQLLNGLYTSLTSYFHHQYTRYLHRPTAAVNVIHLTKLIGIPLAFLIIFIFLYQAASPDFSTFIQQLDLSFFNFQWAIFTCIGYVVLFNCSDPIAIASITSLDLRRGNNLIQQDLKPQPLIELKREHQLATVLITLLNLLILFFISILVKGLFSSSTLSPSDLSKSVHEGVYALIASILLAIGIILYFFRGNLNFYQKNKVLKKLTLVWILLNVVLILITSFKNAHYIHIHGLTYKRLGVYAYLILAFFGLLFTLIKVVAKKNLWYLTRRNLNLAFILFISSSLVPWDSVITRYNITVAQQTDLAYLLELSPNNIFYLKQHQDQFPPQAQVKIKDIYNRYTKKVATKNWQEYTFHNLKRYQK